MLKQILLKKVELLKAKTDFDIKNPLINLHLILKITLL